MCRMHFSCWIVEGDWECEGVYLISSGDEDGWWLSIALSLGVYLKEKLELCF